MGKAITDTEIGYNVGFAGDKFFNGQALADTGATTSDEFIFANALGMMELQILANGAVTTGVDETLVISVTAASESGGSFSEIFSKTIPASTTFADGEEIAAYIPTSSVEDCYTKVTITSDYDASALKVDGVVIEV